MSLKKRLKKLEEKAGLNGLKAHFTIIYPDDYEGELGPGEYRASDTPEAPPEDANAIFHIDLSGAQDYLSPKEPAPRKPIIRKPSDT